MAKTGTGYSFCGATKPTTAWMETETEEQIRNTKDMVAGDKSSMEEGEPKGAKRPAEPGPQMHPKRTWLPIAKIVANPGGGHCLYHAIAQALNEAGQFSRKDEGRSHRQLRAYTIAAVRKHFRRYEEPESTGCRGNVQDATFQSYVDQQQMLEGWGGALEIFAFCEAFGIQSRQGGEIHQLLHASS